MSKEIIPLDNSLAARLQRALYNLKKFGIKTFDSLKGAFGIQNVTMGPNGEEKYTLGTKWPEGFLKEYGLINDAITEETFERREREKAKKREILEEARARAHKNKIENTVQNLKEGGTAEVSLDNLGEVIGQIAQASTKGPDVELNPRPTHSLDELKAAIGHAKNPQINENDEPIDGDQKRRKRKDSRKKDIDDKGKE